MALLLHHDAVDFQRKEISHSSIMCLMVYPAILLREANVLSRRTQLVARVICIFLQFGAGVCAVAALNKSQSNA